MIVGPLVSKHINEKQYAADLSSEIDIIEKQKA